MFKTTILITLFFMVLFPMQANMQGSEKYKGAVKEEKKNVQLKDETERENFEEITIEEKNIAAIESEIEKSTVPTVIKAISLAIAVFGLAYAYFPRKRKEDSNV